MKNAVVPRPALPTVNVTGVTDAVIASLRIRRRGNGATAENCKIVRLIVFGSAVGVGRALEQRHSSVMLLISFGTVLKQSPSSAVSASCCVELLEQVILVDIRQYQDSPGGTIFIAFRMRRWQLGSVVRDHRGCRGEAVIAAVVVVKTQRQLFEIVLAFQARCGRSHLLDSRQQQSDQDCDDRDHDQQFNECEAARLTRYFYVIARHGITTDFKMT